MYIDYWNKITVTVKITDNVNNFKVRLENLKK